jgi:hypothetical protein
MELIWAGAKREVADINETFKFTDVLQLVSDAIETLTVEIWKNFNSYREITSRELVKHYCRDVLPSPK